MIGLAYMFFSLSTTFFN